MDLEGTDGGERADDYSFERKTSLFSLALASVLMVNIWCHDIGRFQASNFSLLRTVFELDLQLFQKESNSKTLVVFVIRDHFVTPFESLKAELLDALDKTWKQVTKPPQFVDSPVTKFFDFQFVAFPHMIHERARFDETIVKFRERFVNPKHPEYLLLPEYQKKELPSDGLAHFASEIWGVIKANKDLDLPSQKHMLAMFRCEEIMETSYRGFLKQLEEVKTAMQAQDSPTANFGLVAKGLFDECIKAYQVPSARYLLEVREKKLKILEERILGDLRHVFTWQLSRITAQCLSNVNAELCKVAQNRINIEDVGDHLQRIVQESMDSWVKSANDCVMPGSGFSFEEEQKQILTEIEARVGDARQAQIKRLIDICKELFENEITPTISQLMDLAESTMWQSLRTNYKKCLDAALGRLCETLIKGFKCSPEDCEASKVALQMFAGELFSQKVKQKAEFCRFKMEKCFIDKFWLDERKLPRLWKPRDNIPQVFFAAKDQAEQILDLYSYMRMSPAENNITFFEKSTTPMQHNVLLDTPIRRGSTDPVTLDKSRIIIQMNDRRHIWDNLCSKAQIEFTKAQHEQAQASSRMHLPVFVIVLLIVLGFNEFKMVLFNPVLFTVCLFVGAIAYAVWMLNLGGYAETLFSVMASTTLSSLHAWLMSHLRRGNNNDNKQNNSITSPTSTVTQHMHGE